MATTLKEVWNQNVVRLREFVTFVLFCLAHVIALFLVALLIRNIGIENTLTGNVIFGIVAGLIITSMVFYSWKQIRRAWRLANEEVRRMRNDNN